jgi:hydrogenase maturation factor
MLAGTVAEGHLIDKREMRAGDRILLTKSVAVEGTAIISREFGDRLKDLGMPETDIETSRTLIDRISVLEEARIASRSAGVSALHDITEGGIATAVAELGIAGRHRLRIDMDLIPIFPQTTMICGLLGLDPLGLIGSGSLLICCRKGACSGLVRDVSKTGIDIACIGEVLETGRGIEAVREGKPAAWPSFEADELTKLFQ